MTARRRSAIALKRCMTVRSCKLRCKTRSRESCRSRGRRLNEATSRGIAMKSLALFFFFFSTSIIAAEPGEIQSGLREAGIEHRPALLDFYGVWCTPCYEMKAHVMVGQKWQALEKRVHFIEDDVESSDGYGGGKKLTVPAPPTFVLLGSDGSELGRIVGVQTSTPFFRKLEHFLSADGTMRT